MKRIVARWVLGIAAWGLLSTATPLLSAGESDATELFLRGRKLVEQGEYLAALADLRASYSALPSPNTLLIIAHAERGIGHRVKAAQTYERVVREAEAKVRAGESRYAGTLADATKRVEEMTLELGRIELRLRHAPTDVKIQVQGKEVETRRQGDGSVVVSRMWIEPGDVPIQVESARGTLHAGLSVAAGHVELVSMDYETTAGAKPILRTAPPQESEAVVAPKPSAAESPPPSRSIPLGTWIAGGVGVIGLGTFAVFGTLSDKKYSDLESCAPRCPESERSTADTGRREQTIANVGLVVGGLGAVTALGFLLFTPKNKPPSAASLGLTLTAQQATLHGSW